LGSIEQKFSGPIGIVEIALGLTLLLWKKQRSEFWMGLSHILYPSFLGI
jgi:hypothetical protein